MKNEQAFIGIGHAPDGVDLPLGLGMNLAQQPAAMDAFAHLSTAQKNDMVHYIQGSQTGEEARERIAKCVHSLGENGTWSR